MLQSTVEKAGGADTVADTVLPMLRAFEGPEQGQGGPELLVGTQASLKDGEFLLNSKKRNVKTVDYNAFVPFTCGEDEQAFLCVLAVERFYLASMGLQTVRFATGTLMECAAVSDQGHVTHFCDGSHGRMTQLPSLLEKRKERTGREAKYAYSYAVCLSEIMVPCVSETDGTLFVPVRKTTFRG